LASQSQEILPSRSGEKLRAAIENPLIMVLLGNCPTCEVFRRRRAVGHAGLAEESLQHRSGESRTAFPAEMAHIISLAILGQTNLLTKGRAVMITEALRCEKKNMGNPDVARQCGHGTLEFSTIDDTTLTRITLQPGWRWSKEIGPTANADSCHAHHLQYVISGRLNVAMDDGTQVELGPGDFVTIPPGHDGWVVGDEPFVALDFSPDIKQYSQ
jgi:mannose-6-phosphate isomerase-like protein (cupin superfamily)